MMAGRCTLGCCKQQTSCAAPVFCFTGVGCLRLRGSSLARHEVRCFVTPLPPASSQPLPHACPPQCTEVDEPYGNIPTEQLKQQLLKEKAAKVGSAGGRASRAERREQLG